MHIVWMQCSPAVSAACQIRPSGEGNPQCLGSVVEWPSSDMCHQSCLQQTSSHQVLEEGT